MDEMEIFMSYVSLFNSALKKKMIKVSSARIAIIKMYLVHSEKFGKAFASTSTIASETGLSRRTVFREKAWLVLVGALSEIGSVARGIPVYLPNMSVILDPRTYVKSEGQSMTKQDNDLAPQSMTGCHTSVTQSMTPCHPYKQKYLKNRTTTEQPTPVVDLLNVSDSPPLDHFADEGKMVDHPKIQESYLKLQGGTYDHESVSKLISAKLTNEKSVGEPFQEKLNKLAAEVVHHIKTCGKTPEHAFNIAMKLINDGRWQTPGSMGSPASALHGSARYSDAKTHINAYEEKEAASEASKAAFTAKGLNPLAALRKALWN